MRVRRALQGTLVAFLATVLLLAGIAPAQADSGDHWWATDGCTMVADTYVKHACVHHDGCYRHHWADRGTCDYWFLKDMLKVCRSLPFAIVDNCGVQAFTYYYGVRLFGEPHYRSPDLSYRIRTPMA